MGEAVWEAIETDNILQAPRSCGQWSFHRQPAKLKKQWAVWSHFFVPATNPDAVSASAGFNASHEQVIMWSRLD